jgi:hypothetical protein
MQEEAAADAADDVVGDVDAAVVEIEGVAPSLTVNMAL